METIINEIAPDIFRLSTYIPDVAPPAGFTFNQFLVRGEQPFLFHTGMRQLFPLVSDAVEKVVGLDRLRWMSFGHVEADGVALDTGGHVLRFIATPHVPHNWESGLWFDETSKTLLAGDLFTSLGQGPALIETDLVEGAMVAEDVFHSSSISPAVGTTLRTLAELEPETIACMHGSSYRGDGGAQLRALADRYDTLG